MIKINSSECFVILRSNVEGRHTCLVSYLFSSFIAFIPWNIQQYSKVYVAYAELEKPGRRRTQERHKFAYFNNAKNEFLRALHEDQEHFSFLYSVQSFSSCQRRELTSFPTASTTSALGKYFLILFFAFYLPTGQTNFILGW